MINDARSVRLGFASHAPLLTAARINTLVRPGGTTHRPRARCATCNEVAGLPDLLRKPTVATYFADARLTISGERIDDHPATRIRRKTRAGKLADIGRGVRIRPEFRKRAACIATAIRDPGKAGNRKLQTYGNSL